MRNLLNFLLKYNYWFLFIMLEVICFALLFRFNHYQGSAFFTSSNWLVGTVYEAVNNVTGYFHLKAINDDLVQKNVELELQIEHMREKLANYIEDGADLEQLKQDALVGYDIYKAQVINNSLTHANNYITLNKGEKDGIRSEMGVVNGSGVSCFRCHTMQQLVLRRSWYRISVPESGLRQTENRIPFRLRRWKPVLLLCNRRIRWQQPSLLH